MNDDHDGFLSLPSPVSMPVLRRALRLEGVAMLVVDRDPEYLDVMTLLLRMHGAEVQAVTNAAEAMRAITAHRPEVLLADPRVVGPSVHFALRKSDGARLFKVAVSEDPAAIWPTHLRVGYDAIVGKPFDVEELVTMCRRALWSDFGEVDLAAFAG